MEYSITIKYDTAMQPLNEQLILSVNRNTKVCSLHQKEAGNL